MLKSKQQNREIPIDYGFSPNEAIYKDYEPIEILPLGNRRAKKSMRIILPEEVWNPRAVLWVQALETLYEVLYN